MKVIINAKIENASFLKGVDFKVFSGSDVDFQKISHRFFKREGLVGILPNDDGFDETFFEEVLSAIETEDIIDYREAEEEKVYLNGLQSIVFEERTELAFCGINTRADETLFEEICEDFEYTPIPFLLEEGLHTSDMIKITPSVVFLCTELIKDKKEKKLVVSQLKQLNRPIVNITTKQVEQKLLERIAFVNDLLMEQKVMFLLNQNQREVLEKVGYQLTDIELKNLIVF